MAKAKRLIEEAASCGADAVKFQLYDTDRVCSTSRTQYALLRQWQLSVAQMAELRQYARTIGIQFGCTPDHQPDAAALADMDVDFIKIGSGAAKDREFRRMILGMGLPTIISTGMMTEDEVLDVCCAGDRLSQLTVLHCVSAYPCPLSDLNLSYMNTIRRLAPAIRVGYSSHYAANGLAGIACAALRADCYEFHLALAGDWTAPDFYVSLEPDEAREMITAMRDVEVAMGDGIKRITDGERETMAVLNARK